MDFLRSHLFSAFLISVIYFILKSLQKRIYKDDSIAIKVVFKDSVLIFAVAYGCLILKDNFFLLDNTKAQVFTSEPNF